MRISCARITPSYGRFRLAFTNTVPVAAYRGAGQLLTGSFMDYCMPRAGTIPPIRVEDSPIPATSKNSER